MAPVSIRTPVDASALPSVSSIGGRTSAEPGEVFPQSVASGGPTPDGVIIWTRIDADRYRPPEALRFEVALDDDFENVVERREAPEPSVKPTDDYTIRIDLEGLLSSDTVYYYRFAYDGVRSRTGRCRTLPAPDESPDALAIGVLNCQNYQNGYFGAIGKLAETEVDFVLHLGDYIYEEVSAGYPKGEAGPYRDRRIELPSRARHAICLEDFRALYQTYKTDPLLQRLHERHTVLQTWDDHAIANDRYWDYETDLPVFPDHPCDDVPELKQYITRAGIQAWWEYIPARISYDPSATHTHESFTLYDSYRFGSLVTLLLTDERLFRSRPPSLFEALLPLRVDAAESRTMLGDAQRTWFLGEIDESDTAWTVWANSVLFEPMAIGTDWLTPWHDSWDGYEDERAAIVETVASRRRSARQRDEPWNFVTLTGDMHTTLATTVTGGGSSPIGVEFMTPGVTSVNFGEKIGERLDALSSALSGFTGPGTAERLESWARRVGDTVRSAQFGREDGGSLRRIGVAERLMRWKLRRSNRGYQFVDSSHWGYSVVEFSPESCIWEVFWVDKSINSLQTPSVPGVRVVVPAQSGEIRNATTEVSDESVSQASEATLD